MECFRIRPKQAYRLHPDMNVGRPINTLMQNPFSPSPNLDVAVITGLFLACYSIGSAFGNSISGAIWNQLLPAKLESTLGNSTLAASIYADPFPFVDANPMGTPDREAVVVAYREIQRLLCIAGICLAVPIIALSLVLRDPKLGKEQSLPDAEGGSDTDESSEVRRI